MRKLYLSNRLVLLPGMSSIQDRLEDTYDANDNPMKRARDMFVPNAALKMVFLCLLFGMFPMTATSASISQNNAMAKDSLPTHLLDEVIVKSKYQYAKRKGDKFMISFKGSTFYEGKTIAEGLELCPLISRQGDIFKILGKESTVIYVNGRPSTLTGVDLAAYLDTKKIDEIERVEIITMPSGKFASANNSGIINIITSQKDKVGAMAMLNTGVVKGRFWGELINGMFAFSIKKVNINIFANYANQKKARVSNSLYEFSESAHVRELSDFTQHGKPLATMGSVEWREKNNLIGCSYTYSSLSLGANYNNSSSNTPTWTKNSNTKNHYHTLQMYDDWSVGKTTISFLYSLYDRRNETNDIYSAAKNSTHADYAKHKINNIKLNITSKLSDSWEIEYGVSSNDLRMFSQFSYDDWKNSVRYKENVWKGYLSTSNEFGRWGIVAVLNFEHTKQDFADNKRVYNSWLPNLNITYKNNWGQFYGQFSKTIERMPYYSLTLSPVYFSPQSITIGNPNLKPEESYNANFGINKGNLNVEIFYKKYKNISMLYSNNDNGRIINSYINLNNEYQYGVNISYSRAISTILLGRISVSSYYVHSNDKEIGENNSLNNYLNTGLSVHPDKKKRFDADVRYWALLPQKERGVKWRNRGSLDIDLNYNIIPSSLRLTFSVKDLFNQNFAHYSRMYNNINVETKNTFDNRKISLTIKYTLSNKARVGKNQQKLIDGLNRIPIE